MNYHQLLRELEDKQATISKQLELLAPYNVILRQRQEECMCRLCFTSRLAKKITSYRGSMPKP